MTNNDEINSTIDVNIIDLSPASQNNLNSKNDDANLINYSDNENSNTEVKVDHKMWATASFIDSTSTTRKGIIENLIWATTLISNFWIMTALLIIKK